MSLQAPGLYYLLMMSGHRHLIQSVNGDSCVLKADELYEKWLEGAKLVPKLPGGWSCVRCTFQGAGDVHQSTLPCLVAGRRSTFSSAPPLARSSCACSTGSGGGGGGGKASELEGKALRGCECNFRNLGSGQWGSVGTTRGSIHTVAQPKHPRHLERGRGGGAGAR